MGRKPKIPHMAKGQYKKNDQAPPGGNVITGAPRATPAKVPLVGDLSAGEKLFDLYDRMIGHVHIPDVLADVAQVVCQDSNAQRATIYMVNHETDELESVGVIGNVTRTIRVPIHESSLAGFCAMHKRAFVVPDAYADLGGIDPALRFDRKWDEINNFRTRDVMCCPALFKDDVMGVVQVVNSRGAPFREADLVPLRSVSRLIGYALYHARLYDDLATMKRLEKEKAEFMRIMVHELKSPVAATKMMTDALVRSHIEQPSVVSLSERIAIRMDQLIDLISDLMDLSRVKSGNPLGDISVFDLTEETRQAAATYLDQAAAKGLSLEVSLPDDPVNVRFDSQGYRLVLSNLISNAVKYTQSGSVDVSLSKRDGQAVLAVRDTGIGIPQAEVAKLFREFFRASNAKSNRIPGSGVGLAGVKHIVERFGGQVELQSEENAGSTFIVRLPLNDS